MKYEYETIEGNRSERKKDLNVYGRLGYLLVSIAYSGQYQDRYEAMLVREIGKNK